MAEKKKPVKKRSDQGRVAPTKKGMDKAVQGRVKKGEVINPGKLVGKLAAKVVKSKAVKETATGVKRLNPSKKTFGQINKEVSKASKNTKAATNKVEKRALKAANSPSKNKAASDSGRKYMGEKYMTTSFPSPGRFSVKPDVKKLKEATTPRTPKGTARLNPKFVRDLRKGR